MAGLSGGPARTELTEQIKELIALGAAIGANCEPCFKFHYDAARKLGVSTDIMREAVRVGETVKAASASTFLGLADRLLGSDQTKRRHRRAAEARPSPRGRGKSQSLLLRAARCR